MFNLKASGKSMLEELRAEGHSIEAPCGGTHSCGKCKLRVLSGRTDDISPEEAAFLSEDEIKAGCRLACFAHFLEGGTAEAWKKDEGSIDILSSDQVLKQTGEPVLKIKKIAVKSPSLENSLDLWECFFGPEDGEIRCTDLELLCRLPVLLQQEEVFAVLRDGVLIDLKSSGKAYGAAIDIGTTTVALDISDLNSGESIAKRAFTNPQKDFGLDVLSRINFSSESDDKRKRLQQVIADEINASISSICSEAGLDKDDIYSVCVAANATMTHALLGLPLKSLGRKPYAPLIKAPGSINASQIGLSCNKNAELYLLPAVSAYIGGDIVAGASVCRLEQAEDTVLFIDIGTNGEIVLSDHGKMIACSCAAGPALEGMNISCGMRAETGAIESVKYEDGRMSLRTINNGTPQGLCGSGLIEAVSEGLRCGAILQNGRLNRQHTLVNSEDGLKLIISEEFSICLTQKDIRQVQLCKAAILSGIEQLTRSLGLGSEDIDRVLVAGQFGKHLSPEALTGAGFLPFELIDKIEYIGNSSHSGARNALVSEDFRKKALMISRSVDYLELSVIEGYEKAFVKAMNFDIPKEIGIDAQL